MTDYQTAHARLTKALSEPFPREEIDLDDVRSILAASQQSAKEGDVVTESIDDVADRLNPYPSGSPRGDWKRGFLHQRMLGYAGSAADKAHKEGAEARAKHDAAPAVPSAAKDAEDAAMLDFMIEHEAWVAWSRDRECCRVFSRDEEGNVTPMTKWGAGLNFDSGREAIRAAIAAANAGKDKDAV